jgi:phosphoserine phosphatase
MAAEPLPSWREGPARSAILDFVARVTRPEGPEFVPPAERIAVFDNDGTLWCEQPVQIQVLFAQQRLAELALEYPALAERQPFRAFLERDIDTIHGVGRQGVLEIAFEMFAGTTTDEFAGLARHWFETAIHPHLDRRIVRCAYQPQLELLAFLRAHRFKTYIVSGGGIDFIRAVSEAAYGIPPEQVIGSSLKLRVELRERRLVLVKAAELNGYNDRETKAENIALHIGRRPILAFGNSDGDLAMLRYVATGEGPRLALLLHHDDADREFAYDREFRLSPLAEALDRAADYGLTIVGMKDSWSRVFLPARRESRQAVEPLAVRPVPAL